MRVDGSAKVRSRPTWAQPLCNTQKEREKMALLWVIIRHLEAGLPKQDIWDGSRLPE